MKRFVLTLLLFCPFTAYGRFLNTDADEIDQEETLNSEFHSDTKCYEFPREWDDFWQVNDIGYRVTAGSLNANKFFVHEDIKFLAPSDYPVTFSFAHHKLDTLLERRTTQELRLIFGTSPGLYAALLAEGGHFKKYGDMGGAVGWRLGPKQSFEVYYVQVDLFYNVKDDVGARYKRDPWTLGSNLILIDSKNEWVKLNFEYDKPLLLREKNINQTYRYNRRWFDGQWTKQVSDGKWHGHVQAEGKEESRDFGDIPFSKHLKRHALLIDNSVEFPMGYWLFAPGLLLSARQAEYTYNGDLTSPDPEKSPPEGQDPNNPSVLRSPDSLRRELMPYATMRQPLDGKMSHWLQYGLHESYTEIRENKNSVYTNEVKFQFAYEFRFTNKSYLQLNTAWDLDNIASDFPYKDAFRPWDGGNIQLYAVF